MTRPTIGGLSGGMTCPNCLKAKWRCVIHDGRPLMAAPLKCPYCGYVDSPQEKKVVKIHADPIRRP